MQSHPKRLQFIATALTLFSCLCFKTARSEQPLVFVSLPDVHHIEAYLGSTRPAEYDFLLSKIALFKPSFVLMPGDLGGQHWWENSFQKKCAAPGKPVPEVVMACAAKTYPRLLEHMAAHSLTNVHIAVGDHEIGDNNWPLGKRSNAVPFFKAAFAKYFTKNKDGSSKYGGKLGNVPLRPVGTPYENTSYGFLAGNALFIVVDEFRQQSPTAIVGLRGTVQPTIDSDGHLQWLENLLAAARRDPSIKHILISGHMPVLTPVRAQRSSMIYLDGWGSSRFWNLLRKYHADVYLGGEVHQHSAIIDNTGSLIQIINKGGCCNLPLSGFLVGRIFSNKIEFDLYLLRLLAPGKMEFFKESTLTIDKAGGNTQYSSVGQLLRPIDPRGLLLHYSFDGDMKSVVKNSGSFGTVYDLGVNKVWPLPGVLGQAGWFDHAQASHLKAKTINPLGDRMARSVSLWLRTTRKSQGAYLYPSGQFWDPSLRMNSFRLMLADGILKLQINKGTTLQANQGARRLNDDKWHHVALTYERDWKANKDNIAFYIDGQPYGAANSTSHSIRTEISSDQVIIGGKRNDQANIEGWTGSLDDFGLWASKLEPGMVKAIHACANVLKYNASDMEALFKLFRRHRGKAFVKGFNWSYADKLTGTVGLCLKTGNRYTLSLNASGQGVSTIP